MKNELQHLKPEIQVELFAIELSNGFSGEHRKIVLKNKTIDEIKEVLDGLKE